MWKWTLHAQGSNQVDDSDTKDGRHEGGSLGGCGEDGGGNNGKAGGSNNGEGGGGKGGGDKGGGTVETESQPLNSSSNICLALLNVYVIK